MARAAQLPLGVPMLLTHRAASAAGNARLKHAQPPLAPSPPDHFELHSFTTIGILFLTASRCRSNTKASRPARQPPQRPPSQQREACSPDPRAPPAQQQPGTMPQQQQPQQPPQQQPQQQQQGAGDAAAAAAAAAAATGTSNVPVRQECSVPGKDLWVLWRTNFEIEQHYTPIKVCGVGVERGKGDRLTDRWWLVCVRARAGLQAAPKEGRHAAARPGSFPAPPHRIL